MEFRFIDFSHRLQNKSNNKNVLKVFELLNELKEYGSIEHSYSNIDDMDKQLKSLVENGNITEANWEYSHLKKIIDDQTEYVRNQNKSLEDIVNHYSSVKDFNNITSKIDQEGLK